MVMDSLGIEVDASDSDNMKTLQRMKTNPNSKLKGIFDLREQWVKELRDKRRVKAVKISTDKNVADMMAKCLIKSNCHE